MLLNLKVARLLEVASGRGINLPQKPLLGKSSGDCVLSPEIEIVKSSPSFECREYVHVSILISCFYKKYQFKND